MPEDSFRMVIAGPSGSGKTNTLLHMIYNLLHFDEILLFAKNLLFFLFFYFFLYNAYKGTLILLQTTNYTYLLINTTLTY